MIYSANDSITNLKFLAEDAGNQIDPRADLRKVIVKILEQSKWRIHNRESVKMEKIGSDIKKKYIL